MSIKDTWKFGKTRTDFACAVQDIIERNKSTMSERDFVDLSAANQVTFEMRELLERLVPVTPRSKHEMYALLDAREHELTLERRRLIPKISRVTRSITKKILDMVDCGKALLVANGYDLDTLDAAEHDHDKFVAVYIKHVNSTFDDTVKDLDRREREIRHLREKFKCNA